MTLKPIIRDDYFQGSDRPFIRVAQDHISFNSMFARIAGIKKGYRVTPYEDSENFLLGFEFHEEDKPNSLSVSQVKRGSGFFCAAQGIVNKFPWIKSVAKLPARDQRFYNPKKNGNIWTIQLCPAFEVKKARESEDIPSGISGIYRYLNEAGEIVHIGRGEIKTRLKSPERRDWNFDVVEYSELKDPDSQVKWETYWIEKYREQNNGKFPIYNKISGFEEKE